jgi:hypothetical protein
MKQVWERRENINFELEVSKGKDINGNLGTDESVILKWI